MMLPHRVEPMPVKYWSRAGLMLTDWCNSACACCYANCSPAGRHWMAADQALGVWEGLVAASPYGCRVHLTGGEPFGRFDLLLEVCRKARRMGLGPLEAVETNGFWAKNEGLVRQRLAALDQAGLGRLAISADPYHQQFVPIARVRLLARIAIEVLGAARVRVRWDDWLEAGFDTGDLSAADRLRLFEGYAAQGRERFTGRAAGGLSGRMSLKPAASFDDNSCGERLLRGRHVHVAPTGEVWLATCIGIVAGNALGEPIREIWRRLDAGWRKMPVIGPLCAHGPTALLELARQSGFEPRPAGYGARCELCFAVRAHLLGRGVCDAHLGPLEVYGDAPAEDLGTSCRKTT